MDETTYIDPGDTVWAVAGASLPVTAIYILLLAPGQSDPADILFGIVVFPPLLSVVLGLVAGLVAVAYNLTAGKIGGVRVDLEQK